VSGFSEANQRDGSGRRVGDTGEGRGVPAGGGRRGRRDNGLVASEYAAAGDVDPRVGEHLLDVLAAGGIAAYLQPSTDQHPVTRTTSLPARPTDRLFVDREHLGAAREYLREVSTDGEVGTDAVRDEGGDPAEPDVDAAWEEIVATFDAPVDPADPPWPKSEEVSLGEPRPLPQIEAWSDPRPEPRRERRPEPPDQSLLDALDTFGAELPDEDEDEDDDAEGYTPPPPPPLPRISAAAALGVVAIVGGLVLFVWPALLPLPGSTVLLLAFGSMVAGFVSLIWRLRPGDDDDDDFDDGARV
jgi:hypothetical protein